MIHIGLIPNILKNLMKQSFSNYRFYLFTYIILFFFVFPGCKGKEGNDSDKNKENASNAIDNTGKEVVCFVYHRFGDPRYPSTNISIENFREHLKFLRQKDFEVMTLGQAIEYLKSDQQNFQKVAVITIDDGYKSFLTNGIPLLKEFGYSATLFINTESVGRTSYLDWDEIRSISSNGIEIGNHTHSHAYFLDLPENERLTALENEVKLSQKLINENIDITPEVFAYPFGEFSLEMKEKIKDLGFKAAAAQNSGVLYAGTDLFSIPRFPMAEAFANSFKSKAMMKALRVDKEVPESSLVEKNNPPELNLFIKEFENLDMDGIQCFIQRVDCKLSKEKSNQGIRLHLKAVQPLSGRRTLYTVTVPSKDRSQWYWFSHLWIIPDMD